MKNKLGMLVLVLVALVFVSCDTETNDDTGTIKIRITDIPVAAMTVSAKIGIGPANGLLNDGSNATAGRSDTLSIALGDDAGSDWFETYMWVGQDRYKGTAGNYDIGFIISALSIKKVLRNQKVNVNTTNSFSYTSFVNF
jgi:hypothetical protein